ncbi:hypothetical protein HHI36_007991 [Cryptolaemus montrouzieri]|uniref:Protein artemis n=1 Tax=Cryptolaemus montrouzieri TaxID=559131 RepID=A0ABD2MR81_9CUCU
MSTFGGKIKEIPGISIDRFDRNNLDSQAYFLSHCHIDHMVGLNTSEFQGILKERNCFIYVSHVTKAILKKLYPNIDEQIKELDFCTPTSVHLNNAVVSVIPIPSGHCPGSVMFLFEMDQVILYTGDYRMSLNDIKRIQALYDSLGKLKTIHTVYLDTTFFSKKYLQFPSREESLDEICNLIKQWLDVSEKHIINLQTSARYGYEYVFMEIFKRMNMPVHVSNEAYAFYSLIPDMDESVTLESSKTRIHSCCSSYYKNICIKNLIGYSTRTVKMSAMRWTTEKLEQGITNNQDETYFVCYATHASYEEGEEMIKFLKPKEVVPCVLQKDDAEEIFNMIETLLDFNSEPIPKKPKLFEVSKIRQQIYVQDVSENGSDDLYESALESPQMS